MQSHLRFVGVVTLGALSLIGTACAEAPAARTGGKAPLGLNLSGVVYWSTEIPFVDVFKAAQPWTSQAPNRPYGKGGPMTLSDEGWVTRFGGPPDQFAESLLFADMEGHYPSGDYLCLYEGTGEVDLAHAARVTAREPGRVTAKVDSRKGPIAVRVRKIDPADPVRNIRLVLPGFEKTYKDQPFHPTFLKRLQGYQVIRFMDWGHTNNSKVVEWKDRTTPAHATQGTEKGVALEIQIDLANTLGADAWFCVPHRAGDDYVRRFAALVKERLKPERKAYVEYSNETWNGIFEQARHCKDRGRELNLATTDYEAQLRYSSQRSVEVFRICEEVLGKDRLVRVLAAQSANPWTGTTVMDWKDASTNADAIAIAPYFGNRFGDPKMADRAAQMSVDEILEGCRQDIAENAARIRKYAAEAKKRGLKLLAYEGGQHLVGHGGAENNEKLMRLFHAANRHPKMKDLYLEDLRSWGEAGGDLFCLFASMGRYSKWGSWGLLEYHDSSELNSPKFQAVQTYLTGR